MNTSLKNLDLERASFALEKIRSFTGDKKKLKSYLSKLPSLIMANGLIMTLAFIKSKKDEYNYIYEILSHWLYRGEGDFLSHLVSVAPMENIRLTQEAMRLAEWLKRMAEAEIRDE